MFIDYIILIDVEDCENDSVICMESKTELNGRVFNECEAEG